MRRVVPICTETMMVDLVLFGKPILTVPRSELLCDRNYKRWIDCIYHNQQPIIGPKTPAYKVKEIYGCYLGQVYYTSIVFYDKKEGYNERLLY